MCHSTTADELNHATKYPGNLSMIHAQLINYCDQLIQNVTVEILTCTCTCTCTCMYNVHVHTMRKETKYPLQVKCTKPQFLLWVKCELRKSVTPRVSPSALKFFTKCLEIAHFCRRPFQPSDVGHSHQLVLTKICSFA